MNIQYTFKHMPSSKALSDMAGAKISAKIERFTSRPLHAHVTFSLEGIHKKVHVSLITADGYDIEAEHYGEDAYAEIDIVAEKVEAQLRKHKERLTNRKGLSMQQKIKSVETRSKTPIESEALAIDAIDAGEILKFESAKGRNVSASLNS